MPRHYPPDRKADALDRLAANGGDIPLTQAQTGIPQRTLYTWRQELWLQQTKRRQSFSSSPPKKPDWHNAINLDSPEVTQDFTKGLFRLRQRLVNLVPIIEVSLPHLDPLLAADRLHCLPKLIDSILLLSAALPPHERQSDSVWGSSS